MAPYEYYKETPDWVSVYGCVTLLLLLYRIPCIVEVSLHVSFNLLEGNEKVKPNDDTDEMMIGDT